MLYGCLHNVALNALCHQLLGNISGVRWEVICLQNSSRLRLDFVSTVCNPCPWAPNPGPMYLYFPMFSISPRSLMDKALASKPKGREDKRPAFPDFAEFRVHLVKISSQTSHCKNIARNRTAQPLCTATLPRFTAQWPPRISRSVDAAGSPWNPNHDHRFCPGNHQLMRPNG